MSILDTQYWMLDTQYGSSIRNTRHSIRNTRYSIHDTRKNRLPGTVLIIHTRFISRGKNNSSFKFAKPLNGTAEAEQVFKVTYQCKVRLACDENKRTDRHNQILPTSTI